MGARDDLDFFVFCREMYRTLWGIEPRIRGLTACSRVTLSCNVSVEVRDRKVNVMSDCTQTVRKPDTVGLVFD